MTKKEERLITDSNIVLLVPHSRSINSNFEDDVLKTQIGMIFVISISKLTETFLHELLLLYESIDIKNFGF